MRAVARAEFRQHPSQEVKLLRGKDHSKLRADCEHAIFVKNQGKQLIQFGVVGYAEFQMTNDSGADVPALTANNKDRVFAIGPEFGVILPTKKFNFLARVLPEFGARNRTQGVTVVFAIGKSF